MSDNQTVRSTEESSKTGNPKLWLWMIGIALLTLFCYAPIFSDEKEFTNWDDDGYVTNQPLIASLSGANLKKMFDPGTAVMFNYHPLTMLSLAIDYQRAYDEDTATISIAPFVKTNLLFHLLNTALVFLLLYRLGHKKSILLAAGAALIFGIHPLHVESVAWISERKDVLYCFFFLLSCLMYLKYISSEKLAWLSLSLLFFIASCLSKAMAVPLPFILLLTDYLYKRRFTIRLLLEKVPYLLVSIVAGLHTLTVQKGAISEFGLFSFGNKLLFAAAAFCMYCFKMLVPIRLSAFYPYPDVQVNGGLPAFYYLAPLIAIVLIAVPLFLVKKRAPQAFRSLIWAVGFFVLMILLVLPVLGVGSALMADRYAYVSSIGLLFLIPAFLQPLIEKVKWKNLTLVVAGVFVVFCAVRTYARVPVWENSRALWADVIEQYPIEIKGNKPVNTGAKTAYKNLADYYITHNQYDSAYFYYQILTTAGTKDAEVWNNLGNIYVSKNDLPNALKAFNAAIALDTTNPDTYMVRGVVLANSGDFTEAVKDLGKVLQLKPNDTQARAMREDMLRRIKH